MGVGLFGVSPYEVDCATYEQGNQMNSAPRQGFVRRLFAAMALTVVAIPCVAGPIHAGWSVGAARDGYGTILYTADSGGTWTRQGTPGEIADVELTGVHAVDARTAWVVGIGDGSRASIYGTDDAGASWQAYGPTWAPTADLTKVHSPDGERIWAVGSGTILHSADGGASWVDQVPAGHANHFFQGVFSPDGQTVWATGYDQTNRGLILKSEDGGRTWTEQGPSGPLLPLLGVSAVNLDVAWVVGREGTILHTRDGGATWAWQPAASGGFLDVNEVDALTESAAWVAFDAGVQWTLNGGAAWETSQDRKTLLATMGISAASTDEAWWSVYAANPQGGTLGQIWHTRDGGETWTQQGGDDLPGLWTISLVPVPVPAPLTLITLGAAALVLMRRRSAPRVCLNANEVP